jgi:hypothetical protein
MVDFLYLIPPNKIVFFQKLGHSFWRSWSAERKKECIMARMIINEKNRTKKG